MCSSGVVWEMKPRNRWKPFSQKNIILLERTFQKQQSGKTEAGWVRLETNVEVRGHLVAPGQVKHILINFLSVVCPIS